MCDHTEIKTVWTKRMYEQGLMINWELNLPDEVQMYDALSSVCSSLRELVAMSLRLSMTPGDS